MVNAPLTFRSQLPPLNQAVLARKGRCLRSRFCPKLGFCIFQTLLNRAFGHTQVKGNLLQSLAVLYHFKGF
jgi:hypothetical protein